MVTAADFKQELVTLVMFMGHFGILQFLYPWKICYVNVIFISFAMVKWIKKYASGHHSLIGTELQNTCADWILRPQLVAAKRVSVL